MFRPSPGFTAQYHGMTLLVLLDFDQWRIFCKVRESSLMGVARMTRLTPKQRRAGLPTSTSASEREMRPCRRSPWSNGLPLSHMPLWCDRLKDKALPALRMRRTRIGSHEAHTGSELSYFQVIGAFLARNELLSGQTNLKRSIMIRWDWRAA